MTTFLDGPAAGVKLPLRRGPVMLRVVRNADGSEFDALDQLSDEARPGEEIYAYIMVGEPAFVRSCTRGPGGHSANYVVARYRYLSEQPPDADVRTTKAWSDWCQENQARLTELKKHLDVGP